MHEMSLCEGILQVLESESKRQNFKQVKRVWLEIGDLSAVEIDAMYFCYDVVVKGSIANDSELIINKIPGEAWCMQCAKSVPIKNRFDACNKCGSYELQVTTGDEMKIKELEVE